MSAPKPSDQMPAEAPEETVHDGVAGAREGAARESARELIRGERGAQRPDTTRALRTNYSY
jgi:hypothetical protein